tara:strand:- start:249 stop:1358 length:1110 start_codon:yes stop_codon:yes gene_type:complete
MNLFSEAKKVLDKDGKVNPLGPYGKQKLTGREISTYFRRNKVKDAEIRKAVEVALDLGGADSIARKEIKKFYGDKVLKSKEVQNALRYANEEVIHEDLNENYRKLAKYGMGTETSKSAKVGLELDFYDSKGNKQFGKILQKTNTGYLVKDDKGKKHVLKYHDRKKAKDMLKPNYIHVEDAEAKAKLNLKHTQDMEKLKAKQAREKESMSESDMQNVDKAPKHKFKALGFSQHPHKGFEDERLPKDMRDFRQKAKTPSQMRVEDAYRAMWEDGEKYAPQLDEEVANITVDPKNRISKPADQNKHALEINKQAKRFGLKSSMMGKHVRVKGGKKAVNDFLRIVIGKSSYGDPTEKDMSTPQIDKMLTKGLK